MKAVFEHKYLIWMNYKSHYQRAFFAALREIGIDLVVCYYEELPEDRKALGWSGAYDLLPGEIVVRASLEDLNLIPDYCQRIHVVPGYGSSFTRVLTLHLCQEGCQWVHWSERAHTGLRWWLSLPRKRWYANLVNKYALGAFGQGELTLMDFTKWGIDPSKQAILSYAPASCYIDAEPDNESVVFCGNRKSFIFLGALTPRKGIDILLKAFAGLPGSCISNWCIVLVGVDKTNGDYQKLAVKLGIQDQVLFRGSVPASNISSVLKVSDVLVLPSKFDGWGVVLNEAASLGMPLIASDRVGAAYHLIEPGCNGFRFKTDKITSLQKTLKMYVDTPGLISKHGEKSKSIFIAYSPEAMAKRFVDTMTTWLSQSS